MGMVISTSCRFSEIITPEDPGRFEAIAHDPSVLGQAIVRLTLWEGIKG